ncbi:MMPL family transporter [Streptomyces fulvoviolaceus]|uniref:MMPL family transporter n=1 Tax=Streptomyces fulvoviolaceus TaxID=285535 RepID=UPI0021C1601C|nr:MMPL family transporter [Streptomyces fulvoviolaceus]MCT9075172.1 MMPL family transporter [Streptomyces fulvoviolaceus]
MAVFLDRLGRLAFRRRRRVLLMWVVALVAAGTASVLAPAAPDGSYSMPGTESQRAFDLIEQRFPGVSVGGSAEGASAKVVFVAPDGQKVTDQRNRSVIGEVVGRVGKVDQVVRAADPFQADAVSGDGSTAYATVTFEVKAKDVSDAAKQALEKAVEEGRDAGLTVEVGGSVLASQPSGGVTELVGVVVAAVVLLITFASLAAAGLPLLTALIGVGIGTATILALSSALGLSSATSTLALMLGLAVGIDYAMFIVSRYREERARGLAPEGAAGVAVGTAGSSVVFAGLTVVIGLAGLSVVGIPTLTQMGLAAAGTVALSVLVAVTLIPAMLGVFPRAVLARSARRAARADARPVPGRPNMGSRWAGLVVRRSLPVLLVAVAALGVIALPAAKLHLGTAGDESKPTSTTERRAYDDLAKGFGPGFNGPLTIVVDAKSAKDPKAAVKATAREIGAVDGVVSVSAASFNKAGDTAIFTATPTTAPDDERTIDLIHTLRGDRPAIEKATDATFMVSGSTAGNIDSDQKVQGALVPYLGLVVGLAFLLLLIVFRSVLVPLKAALGFLLSVLAALGAVVVVFQWGWLAGLLGVDQTGPVMNTMPIVMVGIVFGLAMDYEVFLVTRIREAHLQGERPGQAIVSGFRHSARVVVAAAVIMISVFSGFIGVGETLIKMIGFGMAIAVLFDAFVVRMTIVPAVLALLGERAWTMPHWLERIVPHVDVEGHALTRDTVGTADTAETAEPTDTATADEAERRDVPVR